MATRKNDFILGLVILGSVIALIAATLWAQQASLGRREDHVEARFRDVGGIQIGNPVVIRGVRSGRVDRMELAPAGWVRVRLTLDDDIVLPPNPVVLLTESSLFGEWQATITSEAAAPVDRDVQRQLDEARRGDDILPGATLPDIAQLTTVAGRIAGDVASVASRVQVAFDDSAARELRTSIRNVADLSAQLAATVRSHSRTIDLVAGDLRAGVASVRQTATAVERVAGRIDSSASPEAVDQMVTDAGAAAATFRGTVARLDSMAQRLERSQIQLDVAVARVDSVMMKLNGSQGSLGLMINDPGLYRNSDSLVIELRRLIADFQKNPRRYVGIRVF
jgi:phospholipid/cholesterol/gamma-HCH transport system substrate-binding protein